MRSPDGEKRVDFGPEGDAETPAGPGALEGGGGGEAPDPETVRPLGERKRIGAPWNTSPAPRVSTTSTRRAGR